MKYKRLLRLYLGLLVIALATMCALLFMGNNEKEVAVRDYPQIREEGILRLITEYSQSGYFVDGDTLSGFQYELGQAIANLTGLEVQMQLEMSLAESFKELSDNECDVIARNIPVTAELKEHFLFTEPIVFNKQVLIQRIDTGAAAQPLIRNQLDLAGKTIYIPKNSPAQLRLSNLAHEIGDTLYIIEDPLYSGEQLAILVAKGDIDYAVCDQQVARTIKNQLPEIDIDTDISFTQLQSWAVRKDAPILLDSLNSWLNQLRKTGLFDRIYRKYYKS